MNKSNIAIWVLSVLLAFAFGAAGTGKLMGVEMLHQSFQNLGLPSWFGYFIGLAEVAGAVGLLVPRLASLAGAGLGLIMIGAVGYHLAFDPIGAAVPALVLLVLSGTVAWVRRRQSWVLSWTA